MRNLYLKSLEIGFNKNDEGISLNEIKENLKELEYTFDDDIYRDWFYRNFEHKNRITFINQPISGVSRDEDNKKLRLSSESLFQYLEYIELKEARVNSISAKEQSFLAIGIALLSLLVSVGISVIGISYQSKSEKQTENQLKELIRISNDSQKVLDSSFYELRKLRLINDTIQKKQGIELKNIVSK